MRRMLKWTLVLAVLFIAAGGGFMAGSLLQEHPAEALPAGETEKEDAMDVFRTERQQLRQMQLSQLNEIIHGSNSESEIIALAQRRLLDLMTWSEQEMTLEGVLALRNYDDVLVTVHTDSVNVMVRSESVSSREAAVILELVQRETGISAGNVKIIPVN